MSVVPGRGRRREGAPVKACGSWEELGETEGRGRKDGLGGRTGDRQDKYEARRGEVDEDGNYIRLDNRSPSSRTRSPFPDGGPPAGVFLPSQPELDVLPRERVRPHHPPACSHRYSSALLPPLFPPHAPQGTHRLCRVATHAGPPGCCNGRHHCTHSAPSASQDRPRACTLSASAARGARQAEIFHPCRSIDAARPPYRASCLSSPTAVGRLVGTPSASASFR